MSEYRPGVCNIGCDERRKRRLLGVSSVFAAAGYALFVLVSGRPETALVATLPLWFCGFVGLFQHRLGFCVAFGMMARYDLEGSGGNTGTISEAEAVRRDRRRAAEVVGYAALAAVVTTATVYSVGFVA